MRHCLFSRSNRISVVFVLAWAAYLLVAEPWERSPASHLARDTLVGRVFYLPLLAGIHFADGISWIRERHSPPLALTPEEFMKQGWRVLSSEELAELAQQDRGFSILRIGVGVLLIVCAVKIPVWVFADACRDTVSLD